MQTQGRGLTDRQIWLMMGGLMMGTFLSTLDVLIVITALPTIVGDLGGRASLSWVITAYLLTSTAAGPVFGKLGDLYGRKRMYQLSIAVFVGGSVLAGVSQGIGQLILARGVQGIGAGGLMALPFAMVADVTPPRQRARFQSVMIINFAVASALGPLVGGLFVDHLSWRWIFFVNIPLGALALSASLILRVPRHRVGKVVIDYLGALLLVGVSACLLLAVTWAEGKRGFSNGSVWELLGVAVVLGLGLVVVEKRAREPILPMRFFRNSRFNAVAVGSILFGLAIQAGWTLMPLFFQVVTGASATLSGVLILPFVAGNTLASIITGRLVSRWSRYKWAPVLGQTVATGGLALYLTLGASSSRLDGAAFMALTGVGIGIGFQIVVVIVQNSVLQNDIGAATAAVGFFRSIGLSFGAAIGLGIYNTRVNANITALVPASVRQRLSQAALQGSPTAVRALPTGVRHSLVAAFAAALHSGLLWTVPAAAVSVAVMVMMPELRLADHADWSLPGTDTLAGEVLSVPEAAGAQPPPVAPSSV
ncbi:MAG TPA: MDR family MFS transporter [Acidimicrobiales bacterium]|nr:MDR family MFS transporter [Acidimicrobiales bacterium]